MKAVALILALAVITGCNARVLPHTLANPDPWEATVNRFWQHIADLNQQADETLKNLRTHQISGELDTLITDTMAELSKYKDDIQTKLILHSETSTGQLSQDLQLLANRLQKDMLDAKERSTEYLGELKATIELNGDDVRNRLTAYTNKLKKRLNKDSEEIRNTVATYLGEIHSRASQNLETMRDHVEPYVQQASSTATDKLSDISIMLQSQAESLGQQLESQAESIKTQLEATVQELRTSLEGKLKELTELFSPYTTEFREKIESIVDKVKETAAS